MSAKAVSGGKIIMYTIDEILGNTPEIIAERGEERLIGLKIISISVSNRYNKCERQYRQNVKLS